MMRFTCWILPTFERGREPKKWPLDSEARVKEFTWTTTITRHYHHLTSSLTSQRLSSSSLSLSLSLSSFGSKTLNSTTPHRSTTDIVPFICQWLTSSLSSQLFPSLSSHSLSLSFCFFLILYFSLNFYLPSPSFSFSRLIKYREIALYRLFLISFSLFYSIHTLSHDFSSFFSPSFFSLFFSSFVSFSN